MSFRNILVAYDGGMPSVKALDKALDMVRHDPEAKLTVLSVYSVAAVAVADAVVAVPSSVQREQFMAAQEQLKQAEAQIASIPNAASVLLEGSPGETIVRYAKQHGNDLIIVGNRGFGPLREFVMGSVSHYVLQHTDVPLLVIK
ncbi:universal stress protein [Paenibacillus sp. GCM10023250]|uniref:universal stress protein n=1 Tax=Paenibacillus sp. GCM10023250 TaxID=3252648 RepID=UPI0036094CCF